MTSRGEEGFSLVEAVVATVILGFIVAAMVGGMATTIATSDMHRQESEANTVLVSAAEAVKQMPYVACATSSTYSPTTTTPPATAPPISLPSQSWAGAVTLVVQFWNSGTSSWDDAPACHDNDGTSLFPLQRVTITVADPGQRATETIQIVKRASCLLATMPKCSN